MRTPWSNHDAALDTTRSDPAWTTQRCSCSGTFAKVGWNVHRVTWSFACVMALLSPAWKYDGSAVAALQREQQIRSKVAWVDALYLWDSSGPTPQLEYPAASPSEDLQLLLSSGCMRGAQSLAVTGRHVEAGEAFLVCRDGPPPERLLASDLSARQFREAGRTDEAWRAASQVERVGEAADHHLSRRQHLVPLLLGAALALARLALRPQTPPDLWRVGPACLVLGAKGGAAVHHVDPEPERGVVRARLAPALAREARAHLDLRLQHLAAAAPGASGGTRRTAGEPQS